MLDWAALEKAVIEGGIAGVNASLQLVAVAAKDKAPVRRVFKGQEEQVHTRLKSEDEISSDVAIRQRLGMSAEHVHLYPPSIVTHAANQMLSHRTMPVSIPMLDRRGRYEARVGRAVHGGQLGGKLRDEIYAGGAALDGNMIRGEVHSPTSYAKQQELGNRHNPAHPYLRPALYENQDVIRATIAASVVASARASIRGGGRTTVTMKLKAG